MSVLGCGWVGLPLAKKLVLEGYFVKGSTTTSDSVSVLNDAGIHPYLFSIPTLDIALESFFLSDVLVITIPFLRSYEDPWMYVDVIKQCLFVKPEVQIIFMSSTSVYHSPNDWVDEACSIVFLNERQKALFDAEQCILAKQGVVLRLGGLYGFDRRVTAREPMTSPVNLVHRDDVVACTLSVIRQGIRNDVFNVVSDEHRTKSELFFGKKPVALDSYKMVSNTKLKQVLGYSFLHPIVSEI